MDRANWEEDMYNIGRRPKGGAVLLWIVFFVAVALLGCAVMSRSRGAAPDEYGYANFPPLKGKQKIVIFYAIDGDTAAGGYIVPCRFRLDGIQAPEKNDVDRWKRAKRALEDRIGEGGVMMAELKGPYKFHGATMIDLKDNAGNSINQWLLDQKYAVPWDGRGDRTKLPLPDD